VLAELQVGDPREQPIDHRLALRSHPRQCLLVVVAVANRSSPVQLTLLRKTKAQACHTRVSSLRCAAGRGVSYAASRELQRLRRFGYRCHRGNSQIGGRALGAKTGANVRRLRAPPDIPRHSQCSSMAHMATHRPLIASQEISFARGAGGSNPFSSPWRYSHPTRLYVHIWPGQVI
jgi:hypothetical protein